MKYKSLFIILVGVFMISSSAMAEDYEKVGVESCDKYVKNYALCLEKMPDNVKSGLQMSLKTAVTGWKSAIAASPNTKTAIDQSCQAALTASKQALQAYGCTWE